MYAALCRVEGVVEALFWLLVSLGAVLAVTHGTFGPLGWPFS